MRDKSVNISQPELRIEQIRLLSRNIPVLVSITVVNSALIAAFFWELSPHGILLAWVLAATILGAERLYAVARYRRGNLPAEIPPATIRDVVVRSALAGTLWGGFSLAMFPANSLPHQELLCFVLGGMAAGAAAGYGAVPAATIAYILTSLLPMIVRLAMVGDPLHGMMAAMATLYLLALIAFSNNVYHSFLDTVGLRTRNVALLAEAGAANRALVNQVEELEASRELLRRQADDLARLADSYAMARDAAEAAHKLKSTFLANMSHELRTPLNAIIGFSELIEQSLHEGHTLESYAENITDIRSSGQHLLTLINALLDISKIEAGTVVLDLSTVAIDEIIEACLALLRNLALEAGVALIPPERTGCVLSADALRLKQALINILSNGIKFTPRGGRVVMSAEAKDDRVQITVADTGCGIAAKDIDRVILPFVQVDSAFNRSHSGTGLGLPIAKQFCELHGGTLELSSAEHSGTTVRISLPVLSDKQMPQLAFG